MTVVAESNRKGASADWSRLDSGTDNAACSPSKGHMESSPDGTGSEG
jgi:hypothetical protein